MFHNHTPGTYLTLTLRVVGFNKLNHESAHIPIDRCQYYQSLADNANLYLAQPVGISMYLSVYLDATLYPRFEVLAQCYIRCMGKLLN